MPLCSNDSEACWSNDLRVFEFTMLNGNAKVAVAVTPLAIDACAGKDLIDVYDRTSHLQECRAKIEAIASSKFDSSKIKDDGTVEVSQSDVERGN